MIGVVTDSSCDLPDELARDRNIEIVPLTIRFGDDEYVDRIELDPADFWTRLARGPGLPETAAPSAGAFVDAYRRLAERGCEGVVAICLSERLSGTFQAAVIAAEQVSQEIPVRAIDSGVVSMALGLTVLHAADRAEDGAGLSEVASSAQAAAGKANVFAALDTLEYLRRGGRVGGAQALVGGLFDVKPLIALEGGAVAGVGRVRTRGKARSAVLDKVTELAPRVDQVAVLHGHLPDIDRLAAQVGDRLGGISPIVAELGPVVGTHTGPGVFGIAYRLT